MTPTLQQHLIKAVIPLGLKNFNKWNRIQTETPQNAIPTSLSKKQNKWKNSDNVAACLYVPRLIHFLSFLQPLSSYSNCFILDELPGQYVPTSIQTSCGGSTQTLFTEIKLGKLIMSNNIHIVLKTDCRLANIMQEASLSSDLLWQTTIHTFQGEQFT